MQEKRNLLSTFILDVYNNLLLKRDIDTLKVDLLMHQLDQQLPPLCFKYNLMGQQSTHHSFLIEVYVHATDRLRRTKIMLPHTTLSSKYWMFCWMEELMSIHAIIMVIVANEREL